jgi:hypothetical protein
MVKGKIRIRALVKFLNLCAYTLDNCRYPAIDEIMEYNGCCRSNAYNYLRALKWLYSRELLDQIRRNRRTRSVQQTLNE